MDGKKLALVVVVGLAIGVAFSYLSTGDVLTQNDDPSADASIVSEDPDFSSVEISPLRSGVNEASSWRDYAWYGEGGVVSFGPWRVAGAKKVPADSLENWDEDALITNPDRDNGDIRPLGVVQEVELPDSGDIRLVLEGRNAVYSGEDPATCSDVTAFVAAFDPQNPNVNATIREIVSDEFEEVTLDISDMAGRTVEIYGLADAGDDGCGLWNSEYLHIRSLRVESLD